MSQNAEIDFKKYIEMYSSLQTAILNYLDEEKSNDNDFSNIHQFFDNSKAQGKGLDIKNILHFLRIIINNHHRNSHFFSRIGQILLYFKDEIKQTFSNLEIFEYFSENRRIQLFLIENQMVEVDESIIKNLTQPSNINYFWPENDKYYAEHPLKFDESKYETYELKRKLGENDNELAQLIRNDSVEEFIVYTNQRNLPLDGKIKKSSFETNLLLNENDTTLIEYAAFFGSIQIVRYLTKNDVELTPQLWIYTIHSNNADLIHFLEENQVEPPKSFSSCLVESIKCHHNQIANYILNNKEINDVFLEDYIEYENYELIPDDKSYYSNKKIDIKRIYDLCKKYPEFVSLLFNDSYLDINIYIVLII